MKQIGLLVIPGDAEIGSIENFAQLVADQVDNRLKVQLRSEPLLDRVDDRELGGTLLGLLEQALRLIEETRVLECDAHARGNRRDQAHLGLAEGVFACIVLDHNRP